MMTPVIEMPSISMVRSVGLQVKLISSSEGSEEKRNSSISHSNPNSGQNKLLIIHSFLA